MPPPLRRTALSARAALVVAVWERYANPRVDIPKEEYDDLFRLVELLKSFLVRQGRALVAQEQEKAYLWA